METFVKDKGKAYIENCRYVCITHELINMKKEKEKKVK